MMIVFLLFLSCEGMGGDGGLEASGRGRRRKGRGSRETYLMIRCDKINH